MSTTFHPLPLLTYEFLDRKRLFEKSTSEFGITEVCTDGSDEKSDEKGDRIHVPAMRQDGGESACQVSDHEDEPNRRRPGNEEENDNEKAEYAELRAYLPDSKLPRVFFKAGYGLRHEFAHRGHREEERHENRGQPADDAPCALTQDWLNVSHGLYSCHCTLLVPAPFGTRLPGRFPATGSTNFLFFAARTVDEQISRIAAVGTESIDL